ncbi:hypothetical protein PFDG_04560, partial [Plasmodium falciparum Dd2]
MTALLAYIRCAHLTIYHIIIGNIKEKNKSTQKGCMDQSGNLFDYVHGEGKDYIYEKIKRDMNKGDTNQGDHLYDKININKVNLIFQ